MLLGLVSFGELANQFDKIKEFATKAFSSIIKKADKFKIGIETITSKFNDVRHNSEKLKDALLFLGALKLGEVLNEFDKIGDKIKNLGNFATEAFGSISKRVEALGADMKGMFEPKVGDFIEKVKSQFKELPTSLEQATEQINSAWQQLKEKVTGHLDQVVDYAKKIGNWLINALNHNPTERIPEAWNEAVAKIKSYFDEWMGHAKDFGNQLVTQMKAKFEQIATDVKELFSQIKGVSPDQMLSGFSSDGLKEFAILAEKLEPVFTQLRLMGSTLADSVVPGLSQVGGAVWEIIRPTEQLKTEFAEFVNLFKQDAEKVISGLVQIGLGIKEALSHMTKAPLELLNIVTSLKDLAVSFGKIGIELAMMPVDVISGLVKLGQQLMFAKEVAEQAASVIAVGISEVVFAIDRFKKETLGAFDELRDRVIPTVREFIAILQSEFISLMVGNSNIFEFGQKISSSFAGAFTESIAAVKEFVDKFSGSFSDLESRVKNSLGFFQSGFEAAFIAISESYRGLTLLGEKLLTPLERLVNTILPELGKSFKSLGGIIGSVVPIIADIVNAFNDTKAFPAVFAGIKEIWEAIGSQFKSVKELIEAVFQQFKSNKVYIDEVKESVGSIVDAVKQAAISVGILGSEIEVTFERAKTVFSRITEAVQAKGEKDKKAFSDAINWIRSAFVRTESSVVGNIEGISEAAKKAGHEIQSGLSEASPGPTYWIRKKWDKTSASVQANMKDIVAESEKSGKSLRSNLSENSPGLTDWIRKKWKFTSESVQGNIKNIQEAGEIANEFLVNSSKQAAELIANAFERSADRVAASYRAIANAGNRATQTQSSQTTTRQFSGRTRLNRRGTQSVQKNTNRPDRSQLGNSLNMAAMSAGGALSNFAPNLAAPLFMAGDMYDVFESFGDVSKTFKDSGLTIGKVLLKLSNGIKYFAGVFISGAIAVVSGGVGMGAAFTYVSTAATKMWFAITGPFLPLTLLIGAIIALIAIFKYNLFGIADGIKSMWDTIQRIVAPGLNIIKNEIRESGELLKSVFFGELKEIWALLKQAANFVVQPFLDFFRIGDKTASTSSRILGLLIDIGKIMGTGIAIILRVIAVTLAIIIKAVGTLLKAIIFVGGAIVYAVMIPIRLILFTIKALSSAFNVLAYPVKLVGSLLIKSIFNTVSMILKAFQFTYGVVIKVGWALLSPFRLIKDIITWIVEKIGGLIGSVTQIPSKIMGSVGGVIQGTTGFIDQAWQGATGFIGGLFGQNKEKTQQFAEGGFVRGPGTGTSDSIPARLSNGEFVVQSAVARQNANLLEAMNRGEDVSSLAVMQTPLPWIPSSADVAEGSAKTEEKSQPVIMQPTVNLNISGDINLKGATGPKAAEEFLESLGPTLARKVREILQEMIEYMK